LSKLSFETILLAGKDTAVKRREIFEYFLNTYELYEQVFKLLKDDSVFYKKSEITRHPMIFYFGHTATFFINKLIHMKIITKRINPEFESIFAVGVDEMAWDAMDNSQYNWPEVDAVRAYRKEVKELISKLIMKLPLTLPIRDDSAMWIILMGIEHERIHIETSLVLHRQMPLEYVKAVSSFPLCEKTQIPPKNEMVKIEGGEIKLGVDPTTHPLYAWDNEYGTYKERVADFSLSKYLVSNAEYLPFVESGGYENETYWDKEGRNFLQESGTKHPAFWFLEEGVYRYRTLYSHIDMPLDWPVEVNALEAEAFCRYKSERDKKVYLLPSESEYALLQERVGIEDIPHFKTQSANLNFEHFASSCSISAFAFKDKNSNKIYDVVGNVWQWSRTPIRGFKGFRVHEAYDDFSVPTFDEKHALILGSSWASSGNLIAKHSRYAFRKHFYQNAGFRYVITENKEENLSDIYESDALVSQYCEFQYGDTHFGVENFAIATADVAKRFVSNKTKALDLGCATGRATFELAKEFDRVEGIDFSARFVQVGVKLQSDGYVAFSSVEEGELRTKKKVTIAELGYEAFREKVSFWQGDACNLKPNFSGYDLIMATNLIDRLYNPKLFLESVDVRLNAEGVLVLTSPYTWQESSTKKEFWLGGYEDENGKSVQTFESLKEILGEKFELVHRQDLAFVIKETARKYQHTLSEVTVWKKR
jgi:5-histidylcysteine sulfoxide synthase/putative 4-mercaptohistidine N1-methyltranferase